MNHWKIMGARTLAGALTVGMLMGQPSLLWAADSAARAYGISIKEKSPETPEKDNSGSGSQSLDGADTDNKKPDEGNPGEEKPDTEKSDIEKPDDKNPGEDQTDTEKPEDKEPVSQLPEEGGSSSDVPEENGSSSGIPEDKEPVSQLPGSEGGSSVVPDPDDEQGVTPPGSSGIPEGGGQGSSALPETPGDSGSQIAPGSSVVDIPEGEAEPEEEESEEEELEDENKVQAGKDFYMGQLKSQFHMVFADDFADIMAEIEEENFTKNGLDKEELFTPALLKKDGTAEETFRAPNWKDIVAVYVLLQKQAGKHTFYFDKKHKETIAEVYARMNPLQEIGGERAYISFNVDDYADQESLGKEERKILGRYSGRECILLCAALTGARGLIDGTFGDEVSEERADIVAAAYTLVGKIPYFFGGKSTAIGWDSRWGEKQQVTAEGSRSTGKTRKYGLDCSGYVTWSFVNGYGRSSASGKIGNGTSAQWYASRTIGKDEQILPGDLVFLQGPGHDGINHVGLVVGVKEDGDVIVSHCSSGHNGVVVQEASRAGFKYIRRPKCFEDGDRKAKERQKQAEKLLKKEEKKQESPYINKDVKVKLRTPADKEAEKETKNREKQVFGGIEKEEKQEEPLIPNVIRKK